MIIELKNVLVKIEKFSYVYSLYNFHIKYRVFSWNITTAIPEKMIFSWNLSLRAYTIMATNVRLSVLSGPKIPITN